MSHYDNNLRVASNENDSPPSSNYLFEEFVKKLSKIITRKQLFQIKQLLHGHMDNETIKKISAGDMLLFYLRYRKLLSVNKLAFLTKIFQDIDENEKLVALLNKYKDIRSTEKTQKEGNSDIRCQKQELKTLSVIEDRQIISLQDCQNILEKLDISLRELERHKSDLDTDLTDIDEKQTDLIEKRKTRFTKYEEAQQKLKEKEDEIIEEREKLQSLESECESMRNKLDALKVKQNLKGESRLNAFQRTLERDEMNTVTASIHNIRRFILDQKQLLMELEENSDELVKKLDFRRETLRTLITEKLKANSDQCDVYKNLELVECKILEIIDEISHNKQSKTEVVLSLQETRNTIKLKSKSNENGLNQGVDLFEVKKLLSRPAKEIDYNTYGTNTYTLGQHKPLLSTSSRQVTFNQPITVNVDRNGDVVAIDYAVKNSCYRLVSFTLLGETNYEVLLDTLKPIGLAIDVHNHYIIATDSLIRIYRRKDFVKQFVPHYNTHSQMELPKIVSIEYNRHNEEILLLDGLNKTIQTFNIKGEVLYIADVSDVIVKPNKLHMLNRKTLVITDATKHTVNICHFVSENVLNCATRGSYGIGHEEFVEPGSIFSDSSENILVCDTGNHRICLLTSSGDYVMSFGRFGTGCDSFKRPVDVTLHHKYGAMIVCDQGNNRVVVYLP